MQKDDGGKVGQEPASAMDDEAMKELHRIAALATELVGDIMGGGLQLEGLTLPNFGTLNTQSGTTTTQCDPFEEPSFMNMEEMFPSAVPSNQKTGQSPGQKIPTLGGDQDYRLKDTDIRNNKGIRKDTDIRKVSDVKKNVDIRGECIVPGGLFEGGLDTDARTGATPAPVFGDIDYRLPPGKAQDEDLRKKDLKKEASAHAPTKKVDTRIGGMSKADSSKKTVSLSHLKSSKESEKKGDRKKDDRKDERGHSRDHKDRRDDKGRESRRDDRGRDSRRDDRYANVRDFGRESRRDDRRIDDRRERDDWNRGSDRRDDYRITTAASNRASTSIDGSRDRDRQEWDHAVRSSNRPQKMENWQRDALIKVMVSIVFNIIEQ